MVEQSENVSSFFAFNQLYVKKSKEQLKLNKPDLDGQKQV